ncbi:MAG: TonB-dependent receptor plug domain-containing protein, partial [Gemmatimonadota bacterium]
MSCHSWTRAALVAALAALPLLPATAPVQAQETGRITGLVTVVNTDRPLAGAQVFIPGTAFGTITSSEGRYLLPNVPVGTHTVSVRLVGYAEVERTVEVTADAAATVDFELRQEAIALDEIVVTGAGQATERRRLGNSIGAIDAGELETAPIATVSDALQGREPGVIVQQSGGIAGEGSTIRIRGSASLSQSNEPIVYVDGMRINSEGGFGEAGAASRLDDLDPSSIERVEILKGAAAATLYGTEASNGVIQIFTKDGAQGDTRWTFTSEWGLTRQDRNRYEPLAGFVIPAEDTIHDANAIRYEAISSTPEDVESFWGVRPEPYEVFEADMQPILFETGMSSAHSLSASGGNELMTYYVSGRLASEDGTFGAEEYGPARDLDQQRQATANVTIFPFENMRL